MELFNLEAYFLYDFYNEYENEFLAATGLENVDVTDKVDTVSRQKQRNSYVFMGNNTAGFY